MLADTLSPAIVPLVCSGSRSAACRMLRALLAGSPLLAGAARRFLWTRHPVAEQYVTRSGAAALAARAMCSSTANHLYDQLLVKEPGTVAATPWHNDTSYWHLSGSMICSIWLAMDIVPKETGVSYVRGSHAWKMRHSITSFSGGGESNYDYGDQSELVSVPDVEAGVASGAENAVCFKSFPCVCVFSQQPVLANDQSSHKQNSSKRVPCRAGFLLLLTGEYELLHWDMEPGDVIIFNSYSLQCVITRLRDNHAHATPCQHRAHACCRHSGGGSTCCTAHPLPAVQLQCIPGACLGSNPRDGSSSSSACLSVWRTRSQRSGATGNANGVNR